MQYYTKIQRSFASEEITSTIYYLGIRKILEKRTNILNRAIDNNNPIDIYSFGITNLNNFIKVNFDPSFGTSILDIKIK